MGANFKVKRVIFFLSTIMASLFSVISTFAEVVLEASPTPISEEVATLSIKPFIIGGIIVGFILALILAIRRANKLYGKGWN